MASDDFTSGPGEGGGLEWWCANPKCKERIHRTVAWLKKNTSYTCVSCKATAKIPETDRRRYLANYESIHKAVDKFQDREPTV